MRWGVIRGDDVGVGGRRGGWEDGRRGEEGEEGWRGRGRGDRYVGESYKGIDGEIDRYTHPQAHAHTHHKPDPKKENERYVNIQKEEGKQITKE